MRTPGKPEENVRILCIFFLLFSKGDDEIIMTMADIVFTLLVVPAVAAPILFLGR